MNRLLTAVVVTLFLLTTSSCLATTGGEADSSPPVGANRPSDEPADEPTASTDDQSSGDQQLSFGDSYTWDDGVSLMVSKPKKFKPSEYNEVKGAKAYLKYTVTVVNKSNAPLDLSLTYITVQSSNKEAEQVFDTDNGLEGSPSTKLLKGRESEYDIGFGVADAKDVVMEVALQDNFERPSLIYST
jgi:hypothetical protein